MVFQNQLTHKNSSGIYQLSSELTDMNRFGDFRNLHLQLCNSGSIAYSIPRFDIDRISLKH